MRLTRWAVIALTFLASQAWAAAPTVRSSVDSANPNNVTSHTITRPATIENGDVTTCIVGVDDSGTVTWPAGWTEIFEQTSVGTMSIAWESNDGTEDGTTFNITTSVAEKTVWRCYTVAGAKNQAPDVATATTGFGTTADPPAITPAGGTADYLFIALAQYTNGFNTVSGFPTGYTGTGYRSEATGGIETLAWGHKAATGVSTEDPGAFTNGDDETWIAQTLAFQEASSTPAGSVDDNTPTVGQTITYTATTAFSSTITGLVCSGVTKAAEAGATSSTAQFIIWAYTDFVSGGVAQNVDPDGNVCQVTDGTDNVNVTLTISPTQTTGPTYYGYTASGSPWPSDSSHKHFNPEVADSDVVWGQVIEGTVGVWEYSGVISWTTARGAAEVKFFDKSLSTPAWSSIVRHIFVASTDPFATGDSESRNLQDCGDGTYREVCP